MSFCVYLMIGQDDNPIYVGKSTDVRSRIASHRRDRQHHEKLNGLTKWEATQRVDVVKCATRAEMDATEKRLIEHYRPVLNKLDNPDDTYHQTSVDAYVDEVMTDEQRIDAYVERVLAQAPPLTNEQRTRLAELLRPVRRGVAK